MHDAQHHGEDHDCGDICSFCCQTVDALDTVQPTVAAVLALPGSDDPLAPAPRVELPTPAHLLPFANGPPIGSTFLG